MERVTGSENISRICEGLSSPHRVDILKILIKKGSATFPELIGELTKIGYKDVTHSLVKHHTTILAFSELVEFHRDRIYIIRPLQRIDIYMEKL